MITLHYSPSAGYTGSNEGTVDYVHYTNLTNVPSDRLAETNSSLEVKSASSISGPNNASPQPIMSSSSSTTSPYPYYSSLDSANYVPNDTSAFQSNSDFVSKSPSNPTYDYRVGSQSETVLYSNDADLRPLQPSSHHQQIQLNVTIGPGTVQQQTLPVVHNSMEISKNTYGAYLSIVEQPTNRIRYRYRSEKGSHGGLNGASSSQLKKTYPTIKLEGYHQSSPVYIRASLATNEEHPKPHVHKLMGRHCSEDGACTLPVTENMTTVFQNLGILFIGKKEVPDILYKRKLNEFQSRFYNQTITDQMKTKLHEQSEKEAKDMNLNSVKICFEAFMLQNEALYPICLPVYSRPIANQKSPDSGELKIVRINRYFGSVAGGDEVYLLCEKVNKKEIRVRFFEIDNQGNQQWEAFGNFNESDVHHQVAIVFRTPPYRDQNIVKPAQVYLQLFRQRDGEFSEPRTFIYKPKTVNDPLNEFSADTLTSKCGIQECVLSRIKMENQPPGYKRRKYSPGQQPYQQPQQHQSKQSSVEHSAKSSSAVEISYSQSKHSGSNIANRSGNKRTQVKTPENVNVKIENESEQVNCNEASHVNPAYMCSQQHSKRNHIGKSFVQVSKPSTAMYMDKSPLTTSSKLMSLSLSSPHSMSSSPFSSSSPSSSIVTPSLMCANALIPVENIHHDPINFDHLDAMWTPPSEPSPPLLVGDFFHSFLPVPLTSTESIVSSSASSSSSSQSATFIDVSLSHSQPQSTTAQLTPSSSLDQLSVVNVSPSIPIATSSSSPSTFQFSNSGTICMLYS